MNETQQRVVIVLSRMIDMAVKEKMNANALSDCLDTMLDDLETEDFFGTEGQLDPRGDQRDARYTMTYVEGVDDGG